MKSIGVIGVGDMGSGLAQNQIDNAYNVVGRDLLPERMRPYLHIYIA